MEIPTSPTLYAPAAETVKRGTHFLPHWEQENCAWFITFRLGDSLPQSVLENWRQERAAALQAITRNQDEAASEVRLRALFDEKIERYLDAAYGECIMQTPEMAQLVEVALRHFDSQRYVLWAWSVMPNHVHVVVQRLGKHGLADILHSWKSYTAHEMNRRLGRQGKRWQSEYFDHLPRSQAAFEYYVDYTFNNAQKAGLRGWQWQGVRTAVWPED